MRYISRLFYILFVTVSLTSCAEKYDNTYPEAENRALKAWMNIHHPELLENYQEDGDYYVDIIEQGDLADSALAETNSWIRFEFTGRDLNGNVCLTRDSMLAKQQGAFTPYTHYVPFFRFCGDYNSDLLEGTYLAMRNVVKLGEKYALERDLPADFVIRVGTEIVIYMPSTVVGVGLSGDGGYEGQYTLGPGRPLVARLKVTERLHNPIEYEGKQVDDFAENNGGLEPQPETPDDKMRSTDRAATDYVWYRVDDNASGNAAKLMPHVYVNPTFVPSVEQNGLLKYTAPYFGDKTYEMEAKINKALLDRFGEGTLEGDSVKLDGNAKVWYICRFLDGFISDTNIEEVQKIIYGKIGSKTAALGYLPTSNKGSNILAWYYTIPKLRFGQWAAMVTSSVNAYGASGKSGQKITTTTGGETDYNDMLNYYNNMNSYYGNSNYGGYYGNYYGGYMGGYYGNMGGMASSPTVKSTSVTTEIQAFTPLIFELYIEPEE